jgi:hypothetical protein
MTMRILAAAVVGMASLLVACAHQPPPTPPTGKTSQASINAANQIVAAPINPDPRVGAIFHGDAELHACTGSVLHSAAGDLVLTAAHCVTGGGPVTFVPGFAGSAAPSDVWTFNVLYLDRRWLTNQDPRADYVIARVSRPDGGSIEARAGSALSLGTTPAKGSLVHAVAYPAGTGGTPIGCQVSVGITDDGYPELPCGGLADGTSGAPWISGSTVTGVIGGLHAGGCTENLSYSSPFDQHVRDLLARAEAGGPGDTPPSSFRDDC